MLSSAEWVLLVWAVLATLSMGYYHYRFNQAKNMMQVSSHIFMGIAEGTTVMKKTATGVVFTNSTEESYDEIRIQNRQGQGTDCS